jgi:hypothetical protein
VSYHNEFEREDEYGNKQTIKVDSLGTEITGEELACAKCVGGQELTKTTPSVEVRGTGWFQEKLADRFKVKLIASAVERVKDRLSHQSKRAGRDVEITVPELKKYLDEHKGIEL